MENLIIPENNFNKVIQFAEYNGIALLSFSHNDTVTEDQFKCFFIELHNKFIVLKTKLLGYNYNQDYNLLTIVIEIDDPMIMLSIKDFTEKNYKNITFYDGEMYSFQLQSVYTVIDDSIEYINNIMVNDISYTIPKLIKWLYHNMAIDTTNCSINSIKEMIINMNYHSLQNKPFNKNGINLLGEDSNILLFMSNNNYVMVLKVHNSVTHNYIENQINIIKNQYFDALTDYHDKFKFSLINIPSFINTEDNTDHYIIVFNNYQYKLKESNHEEIKKDHNKYTIIMKEKVFIYNSDNNLSEMVKTQKHLGDYSISENDFENTANELLDSHIMEHINSLPFTAHAVNVHAVNVLTNKIDKTITKTMYYKNGYLQKYYDYEIKPLN